MVDWFGGWGGVGGANVFTITTLTTLVSSYAPSTPGTSVGGGVSALDCSVNVTRARNLGRCLMGHVKISATCVGRFMGNLGRNTGTNSSGGGDTCCTNVRVKRRMDRRVVGNVGCRVFNGSSARAVDLRGFVTNFISNIANGGKRVAVTRTRRATRSGVGRIGSRILRGSFNRGGGSNRRCVTGVTGGRNMGPLSGNICCRMVGRNGNRVPASTDGMGIRCRKGLVGSAVFSDSCGHGAPTAFHYGRIVPN